MQPGRNEVYGKNKCLAIYTDTLDAKGSFSSLNKFFKDEVTPHYEKHGVKHLGFVTSGDVFTRFAINAGLKLIAKSQMNMRMFGDRESAVQWLEKNLNKKIILPPFDVTH